MKLDKARITLFMTGGINLSIWEQIGIYSREMALYQELSKFVRKIQIINWNDKHTRYLDNKVGIEIVPGSWHFKSRLLTLVHLLVQNYRLFAQTNILKTNQIAGGEIILWVSLIFKKPLLVRFGYLPSEVLTHKSINPKLLAQAENLEAQLFKKATVVAASTPRLKHVIIKKYNVKKDKIEVIPNYVLTDVFKPADVAKKFDLVFIGRDSEEKNLTVLFKAMKKLTPEWPRLSLLVVGGAAVSKNIKLARNLQLNVTFKKNVANHVLPTFLNQGKLYVIPSQYEGHPKTLLEAMSCGLACLGSNVNGIRDVIAHKQNGWLCEATPVDLAAAIDKLLKDQRLRNTLGRNARTYVLSNFSLEIAIEKELAIYRKIL